MDPLLLSSSSLVHFPTNYCAEWLTFRNLTNKEAWRREVTIHSREMFVGIRITVNGGLFTSE